jgi:cell wall-associated NlpC family hydrolase
LHSSLLVREIITMAGINDPLRKRVILAARFCVGSLFRHQGRIPGKKAGEGLDCVGLVLFAGRAIGCALEDNPVYGPVPGRNQLESAARTAGLIPVPSGAAVPGDILLIRPRRLVRHAAILTDRGMIHADGRLGRVVEQGIGALENHLVFRYPVIGG